MRLLVIEFSRPQEYMFTKLHQVAVAVRITPATLAIIKKFLFVAQLDVMMRLYIQFEANPSTGY